MSGDSTQYIPFYSRIWRRRLVFTRPLEWLLFGEEWGYACFPVLVDETKEGSNRSAFMIYA